LTFIENELVYFVVNVARTSVRLYPSELKFALQLQTLKFLYIELP